jgi:HD superfamily phosphohydrolase
VPRKNEVARKENSMKGIIVDPIHGSIKMPLWLIAINDEPAVRRMMFIRQLGLKSSIDFPGAIHTRYSHCIGTMYLAKRVLDTLKEKATSEGDNELVQLLQENENVVMAAGFLHDIGHGPFSHVLDFPLKKIAKTSHEEVAAHVISSRLKILESKHAIPLESVCQIIKGEHQHRFLSQIINGPLDADKLDYILRDSYHIGLRFAVDTGYLTAQYKILGGKFRIVERELGIENTDEAQVASELYVVMWKSLYDLVYYIDNSRIAEKMLEKAVLDAAEENKDFRRAITDPSLFTKMDDATFQELLTKQTHLARTMVDSITSNKLYKVVLREHLNVKRFQRIASDFLDHLKEDTDDAAHTLTMKLNALFRLRRYELICDIIKSRVPHEINIDFYKNDEPVELASKSRILRALQGEVILLKVYSKSERLSKELTTNQLRQGMMSILTSWAKS